MRRISRTLLVPALALIAGCTSARSSQPGDTELVIEALSTQPYLVTGGDVLVEVRGPLDGLRVEADGRDVTSAFRQDPEGRTVGLIEGLPEGRSQIVATAGDRRTALPIVNYPPTGPIISGPQEQPFFCQTREFQTAVGKSLGDPIDDSCSVERRVGYVYLSSETGEFEPYNGSRPADLATATTLDGRTVPFIVRVETGTVNRAIYEIAMLHYPEGPEPSPWERSEGWNGKLVYTHGGGCRGGWFQQGDRTGGVLNQGLLEMGYAVTSASLNVFGQNCNDLLASETHIMVKERFVEAYGDPVYTIATGASGGSYQSHQTADNYPGVFDGIIVSSSFPDVTSATIFTLADSRLLWHYFQQVAPGEFTREQQREIAGFGSFGSIANLSAGAARLDPTWEPDVSAEIQGGEVSLPQLEKMRYDGEGSDGIRATVYDHTVNVYGTDPETGDALRPLDNRGVQYGLAALNDGIITPAQFISLNRGIGGFDRDLNFVPERHVADDEATRAAIASGRILYGGAGLAETPVIDYRSYTDHAPNGDIHMIVHQFSTRERLRNANGHADNHVMRVGGRWGFTEDAPDLGDLFRGMDRWLMAIQGDAGSGTRAEKVIRDRPSDLNDACWIGEGADRRRVDELQEYGGEGACAEEYQAYSTPRQVAGAPLANDIVSCALKPVDPEDYSVALSEAQLTELREIFPEGVCDWSRGEATGATYGGTWQSFGPSAVNRYD